MRFISMLVILGGLAVGGYWSWMNVPEVKGWIHTALSLGKFQTLEVRHSAESIMENHRRQLLLDSEHSFLAPKLKFYPYLLLEVKYTNNSNKTGEGIILWSFPDLITTLNHRAITLYIQMEFKFSELMVKIGFRKLLHHAICDHEHNQHD